MVAGNTCITADKALCEETYTLVRNHQSVGRSNVLTFPSARKYVERLLREAPSVQQAVGRRLAVVSGITNTKGCPAYYVAEELAASANMDVVLAGPSLKTLQASASAIHDEFLRRKARSGQPHSADTTPKVIPVRLNSNSLRSVSNAAHEIERFAHDGYKGQVHALVNLGGEVTETHKITEDGVDANVGKNDLAPRLLADLLLPSLRAAATDTCKPRVVQEVNVGHCQGGDFDCNLLRKLPREGGAPKGTVVWNEETHDWEYAALDNSSNVGVEMYNRSKMALLADTLALAKEEPMLAAVSVDPGVLSYAHDIASSSSSRRSLSSRVLELSHSQAARSALRAALDPDFDTTETMQYLHCDGNPWTVAEPTLVDPRTGTPYGMDEYAEMVRGVGDELCGQLVADKDCGWDQQLYRQSSVEALSTSSSSLLLGDGSESSLESQVDVLFDSKLDGSTHSHWQCHSFHASLLQASSHPLLVGGGRSYSSLFSQ